TSSALCVVRGSLRLAGGSVVGACGRGTNFLEPAPGEAAAGDARDDADAGRLPRSPRGLPRLFTDGGAVFAHHGHPAVLREAGGDVRGDPDPAPAPGGERGGGSADGGEGSGGA